MREGTTTFLYSGGFRVCECPPKRFPMASGTDSLPLRGQGQERRGRAAQNRDEGYYRDKLE